jgi:integrase
MGTIIARPRKRGGTAYLAQIVIKRDSEIVHRQAETFDRRQAAKVWIERREAELAKPGALDHPEDPPLNVVIDRYIEESAHIGKTKRQVLQTIKNDHEIGGLKCSKVDSVALVAFCSSIQALPQTRMNYMSHLSAIFAVARPAWRYPLDRAAIQDAMVVLKKLGTISKSAERTRRPTLDELDRLITHFEKVRLHRPFSAPMTKIIAFAIFSTRRQEEITSITWIDFDREAKRQMVRDMKNPGDKVGNDVLCEVEAEAVAIMESMPKTGSRIFPYSSGSISAAFTRACKLLNIVDLHFHDLRHEGISRLFEMGKTIPQAAAVTGHRSWSSLQRYSHVRQTGDKYAAWKWLRNVSSLSSTG